MAATLAAGALGLGAIATPGHAQSVGAASGYAALVLTPLGGLPPIARPWMAGASPAKIGFDVRWGSVGAAVGPSLNQVVASLTKPIANGRGDVSFGAGAAGVCSGCQSYFVTSLTAEGALVQSKAGEDGAVFSAGLRSAVAMGLPSGGSFLAATLGAPFAVALGSPGKARIVPFIEPGLGWGRIQVNGGGSESGVRAMLGGGVGVINLLPQMGLHAGLSKTFISGGKMVFGAGLSYLGR